MSFPVRISDPKEKEVNSLEVDNPFDEILKKSFKYMNTLPKFSRASMLESINDFNQCCHIFGVQKGVQKRTLIFASHLHAYTQLFAFKIRHIYLDETR